MLIFVFVFVQRSVVLCSQKAPNTIPITNDDDTTESELDDIDIDINLNDNNESIKKQQKQKKQKISSYFEHSPQKNENKPLFRRKSRSPIKKQELSISPEGISPSPSSSPLPPDIIEQEEISLSMS